MKKTTLLLIALTALGCSKGQAPKPEAQGDTDISIPQSLIGNAQADPSEVLVEVNGKSLTRSEAMRQVALRLGGPPPTDMPAGRASLIRTRVLSQVVDQFVKRTLLLEQADKRNIVATHEEIQKGLELIKSKSPEGSTPRGMLKDGVSADDSLANEVTVGIRIDKLLAEVIPSATPTADEIDAFIASNREKLTHPEKGLPSREHVSRILTEKARHAATATYVRELQRTADIQHSSSVRPPRYAD